MGSKKKETFKLVALKVVMVTYKRCSLTRGSKHSDLTCLENRLLSRGGFLQELVTTRGLTEVTFIKKKKREKKRREKKMFYSHVKVQSTIPVR